MRRRVIAAWIAGVSCAVVISLCAVSHLFIVSRYTVRGDGPQTTIRWLTMQKGSISELRVTWEGGDKSAAYSKWFVNPANAAFALGTLSTWRVDHQSDLRVPLGWGTPLLCVVIAWGSWRVGRMRTLRKLAFAGAVPERIGLQARRARRMLCGAAVALGLIFATWFVAVMLDLNQVRQAHNTRWSFVVNDGIASASLMRYQSNGQRLDVKTFDFAWNTSPRLVKQKGEHESSRTLWRVRFDWASLPALVGMCWAFARVGVLGTLRRSDLCLLCRFDLRAHIAGDHGRVTCPECGYSRVVPAELPNAV